MANMNNIPIAAIKLKKIFEANSNKIICVVGASCVGKSTLLSYLPEAVDMDDLLFGSKDGKFKALLIKEEIDYACGPWDKNVGNFMISKAKELIQIKEGHPVFGTIVFPSDILVEITVPIEILKKRALSRNSDFNDILNMKKQIEEEIEKSNAKKIIIDNI